MPFEREAIVLQSISRILAELHGQYIVLRAMRCKYRCLPIRWAQVVDKQGWRGNIGRQCDDAGKRFRMREADRLGQHLFHTTANLFGLRFADYRAGDDTLSIECRPQPPQIIATERKILNYAALL